MKFFSGHCSRGADHANLHLVHSCKDSFLYKFKWFLEFLFTNYNTIHFILQYLIDNFFKK